MLSKGNGPTAEQKRFQDNLRALYPGSELHHAVGGTAKVKINLVSTNIGEWWILALDPAQHKEVHNSGKDRKGIEKISFNIQMDMYEVQYRDMPVPDEVLEAIEDYHK